MRFLVSLLVLCLAGGLGWLCGYLSLPFPTSAQITSTPTSGYQTTSSKSSEGISDAPGSESSALAGLTALAQRKSTEPFAIDAYLFERIEAMAPAEIGALVVQIEATGDVRVTQHARSIVEYWVTRDFPSARDWLKSLPRSNDTIGYYAISRRWAQVDPGELVSWMESLPGGGKISLLSRVTSATTDFLAPEYGERLIPTVLQIPENHSGDKYLSGLFAGWARKSPTDAAARAMQMPSETSKACAVEGVAMAWAERDPKASLAWASTLPDAVLALKAHAALIRGFSNKDPAAAMDHLANLPLTVETKTMVDGVMRAWVEKDASAALRWADALNDESSRQLVFENLIFWNAIRNEDRAMELLVARADRVAPSSKYYELFVNAALKRGSPEQLDTFFAKLPENHRQAGPIA